MKKFFVAFSSATYNNAASCLNSALRAAARWGVIPHVPHHFGLLKRQKAQPKLYDFDQYAWLIEASSKIAHPPRDAARRRRQPDGNGRFVRSQHRELTKE